MKEVPAPHIQYDEQTTGQEQFEKAFDIIFEEVLRRRRHSTPTDSTPIGEHWFTRGSMRHSNVGCGRFTATPDPAALLAQTRDAQDELASVISGLES
ncbi:hypothetical protein [Bradyrhizobium elkanii]|uniref:hypothetical protein n=1 Tax=Bradyrhizobium elkanii TaxID=29448 RepID=UPI00351185CE